MQILYAQWKFKSLKLVGWNAARRKKYITASDLLITYQGMYILGVDGNYSAIQAIFADDYGLYIVELKRLVKLTTMF